MLILPMEQTFNIRRPPVVTFLLLLANVIVFLVTSCSDQEKLFAAAEAYESQQILGAELPLYQAYLKSQSAEAKDGSKLDSVDELGEEDRFHLAIQLLTDREYAEDLERSADRFTLEQIDALEKKQRIVETYIDRLV
ncbi:MAG: hypothetical protein P8X98_11050, partial [Woeseiaceae bacterium]